MRCAVQIMAARTSKRQESSETLRARQLFRGDGAELTGRGGRTRTRDLRFWRPNPTCAVPANLTAQALSAKTAGAWTGIIIRRGCLAGAAYGAGGDRLEAGPLGLNGTNVLCLYHPVNRTASVHKDSTRLPVIILRVGFACIALSVIFWIASGANDRDPALSPAFISTGLTLLYTGWLYLARAAIMRRLKDRYVSPSWDPFAPIPYPVQGIFAVVVGLASVLVGVAGLGA